MRIKAGTDAEFDHYKDSDFGTVDKHTKRAPKELENKINESLGLMPVNIRLQKALVDEIKLLAQAEGIGYQPFMRQILTRYVREAKGMAVSR